MKKKFGKLITGALAFTLVLGGSAYGYNSHVNAEKNEQAKITALKEGKAAVGSLYKKKDLKPGVTNDQILDAKLKVKKITDKIDRDPLMLQVDQAQQIFDLHSAVKGLIKNGVVKDNVKLKDFDEAASKLEAVSSFNLTVYKSAKSDWKSAKVQYLDIKTLKKQIAQLEKAPTEKGYKKASSDLKGIKNKTSKSALKKRLNKVEKKLESKKAKAEAKKKEAAKKGVEQAKTSVPNNQVTSNQKQKQTAPAASGGSYKAPASSNGSSSSGKAPVQKPSQTQPSTSIKKPVAKPAAPKPAAPKPAAPKPPVTPKPKAPKPKNSNKEQGKNWDQIGKDLENRDWNKVGSGDIDKGGNGYEDYR